MSTNPQAMISSGGSRFLLGAQRPLRIAATALESFRLYMHTNRMNETDLIASLKGKLEPTPAMRLGHAFDRVMSTPDRYKVAGGYRSNGYTFDDATMQPALALRDRHGITQVKATKDYDQYTVVAVADCLAGATLIEYKTTAQFQYNNYAESYQWRLMADIFQPREIRYHVFCVSDHGNTVVTIEEVHSFSLYPYQDLHRDCANLVHQFVAYIALKRLDQFLAPVS